MSVKSFALAVLTCWLGSNLWAQEPARVLSSTPIVQSVDASPASVQNVVAYRVLYEFAGKQYQVDLPYEPGPTLLISVSPEPMPAPSLVLPPPPVAMAPAPLPAPVYISPYPYPYPYPYYYGPSPFSFHFGIGYYRGHGHRWR